nr:immunoglobulin light chain junction region [Macaca mulatta]
AYYCQVYDSTFNVLF